MTDRDPRWQALLQPHQATRLFDYSPPPLEPAEDFSWGTAWWLANLCHAAYLRNGPADPPPAGFREAVLADCGFREAAFIDEGAIQGVLATRERLAVLAFRGTDDPRDWSVNARIEPRPWPGGGQVHGGFLEAFDRITRRLSALRGAHPGHRWLVTGHSQGAAMAVLATDLLQPVAVYGFGSPRLGDAAFADTVAGLPVYQVINGRDIICRLPPAIGDFDACMPGEAHRVGAGVDTEDDGLFDMGALLQRAASPGEWTLPVTELADHAIVNYVAAIEEKLDGK